MSEVTMRFVSTAEGPHRSLDGCFELWPQQVLSLLLCRVGWTFEQQSTAWSLQQNFCFLASLVFGHMLCRVSSNYLKKEERVEVGRKRDRTIKQAQPEFLKVILFLSNNFLHWEYNFWYGSKYCSTASLLKEQMLQRCLKLESHAMRDSKSAVFLADLCHGFWL